MPMTNLYRFSENSAYSEGVPEIFRISKGLIDRGYCLTCDRGMRRPEGDLIVELGRGRPKYWPDAIPCGGYPCFVVSEKFMHSMAESGVEVMLGGKVVFERTPKVYQSLPVPGNYYWLDGDRHFSTELDFDASGFVNNRFCEACGARSDDISASYDRRHAQPPPGYVFKSTPELDIFTTDISPTAFFCTQKVLDIAKMHSLTNLSFTPVEMGDMARPIKY